MYLVREIMFCKPGKVRPLVQKFQAIAKLGQQAGMGTMRIMTDVSAERYWTVVSEFEAKSLDEFAAMMQKTSQTKEFQDVMKDYHDLVESGRREIYTIEG